MAYWWRPKNNWQTNNCCSISTRWLFGCFNYIFDYNVSMCFSFNFCTEISHEYAKHDDKMACMYGILVFTGPSTSGRPPWMDVLCKCLWNSIRLCFCNSICKGLLDRSLCSFAPDTYSTRFFHSALFLPGSLTHFNHFLEGWLQFPWICVHAVNAIDGKNSDCCCKWKHTHRQKRWWSQLLHYSFSITTFTQTEWLHGVTR